MPFLPRNSAPSQHSCARIPLIWYRSRVQQTMIFAFPVLLFFLVLWILTVLTWIEGLGTLKIAGESKSDIRGRILPPLILLTVPFAALVFLVLLRLRHATDFVLRG